MADAVYLLDTLYFRHRVMYLDPSGIYETNRKLTLTNFIKQGTFKHDAFSLLPLDYIYYFAFGTEYYGWIALLRLPKLARYHNISLFFDRLDSSLPFPLTIRLTRTVNIMMYLIHLAACAYFSFSDWNGIGSTGKSSFEEKKPTTSSFAIKMSGLTLMTN